MSVRFIPLLSGSRANATLVDFGSVRLLVDAGIAARPLATRLRKLGVDPGSIDWILLSHEHSDHSRGAERFSQLNGVPVVCSNSTLVALDRSPIHFAGWIPLPDDGVLDLGPVRVDAFPVPHDAARPVGFVLEGSGLRIGIATDLGHATPRVVERLAGCQLLMVESNYDPTLLATGPYPWHLKQRVSGRHGHLSNEDAAAVLRQTVSEECRAVVLAHLSEHNNRPDLARRAASRVLAEAGRGGVSMRIAAQRAPTPPVLL